MLKKDFDEMKINITKVEVDLGTMRSNLNECFKWCNIQQTTRLINKIEEQENKEKFKALKEKNEKL